MIWQTVLLTAILVELITIFFRFKLKMESKNSWTNIMKKHHMKKIIHFHHGFIGLIIILLAILIESNFLTSFGIGLTLSDAIHHFIVLQIATGSPEFHLFYKNRNR